MARLDGFIERLFGEDGTALHFESGKGAVVHRADGPLTLIKQPLTSIQITNAIAEVLPDDMRSRFPADGELLFAYGTNPNRVAIRFEKKDAHVWVEIVPDPEGKSVPPVRSVEPRATVAVEDCIDRTPTPVPRPPAFPVGDPREAMDRFLAAMVQHKASDLHLASGCVPTFRIDGWMRPMPELGLLKPDVLRAMLYSLAPERNRAEWEQVHDTDFAHETEKARFRVNMSADRNGIGAVLRMIPRQIPTAESLGLPPSVLELCNLRKGLVVVTGPTGSGKSTTLGAMIHHINRTREDHIITIEDPIEFVHENRRCLINQREVGVNTGSFKQALRAALREDPDIVLVGEMRDLETVSMAIETAETGPLVFASLHTNTAASTVDRMIDQFPADRQSQIRLMLSESLKGVIAQNLCRKIGGGRVAALEVLLCTTAVANLVREGKTYQIPSVMQTNRSAGMIPLNDALLDLVKRQVIEPEEAMSRSLARSELRTLLDRAGFAPPVNVPGIARVGT
jgi:twitching motility protein PilT